jgi:hypothetical protein
VPKSPRPRSVPVPSRPRRPVDPGRSGHDRQLERRWPGIRGEELPAIPDEPTLRAQLVEHPGYSLLVHYLDRFRLEAAVCCRHLASPVAHALDEWRGHVEHQKVGARVRAEAVGEQPPLRDQAAKQAHSFSLGLGWVLMTVDNLAAARQPQVCAAGSEIGRRHALTMKELLRWSFVPGAVIRLLDVRIGEIADRRIRAKEVRRYRRQQALGRESELPTLETSRDEARRWADLGLDKRSSRSSMQRFWVLVFKPLIDLFLGHGASLHRACADASRLVQARYPDLWKDRPDRLRKRYPPRSSGRRR